MPALVFFAFVAVLGAVVYITGEIGMRIIVALDPDGAK